MKNFLILWIGQFISAFGSSMSAFAISIWAFEKTGSALVLSISAIAIMLPKIFVNLITGPFIDKLNKKHIMLSMDILSSVNTGFLFLLLYINKLEIGYIYLMNIFNGIFNCIQSLASDVAISQIVSKNYYTRISGLQSFADGIIRIIPPILTAIILKTVETPLIIFVDFLTLIISCITLALFVKIPFENIAKKAENKRKAYFTEMLSGFAFIKNNKILSMLILFFSFIDFVSGITYANLITPMILARSGNNANILSFVRCGMGIGNILGGFITGFIKIPISRNKINIIFLCCLCSFLGGDLLLGITSSLVFWMIGGFLGNVFTPMAIANQNYLWRTIVPIELQGKVFSFKKAISNISMVMGIFLGGFLADYLFEPFMVNNNNILNNIFGSTKGSGMGLMFAITGISGIIINISGMRNKKLKRYVKELG
jgi:hypothetical protein